MTAGSPTHHVYEPRRGHGLPHDPFKAIVAPRPIGWIGTRAPDGVRNLAPYSFFNALAEAPPIVGFGSVGLKDSARNAAATGVFTWSLATRALAERMNRSSATVAAEVDEFVLAELDPETGRFVDAPFVADAPAVFECRLTQQLRLRDAAGAETERWLTLGEVVGVRIRRDALVDGIFDLRGVGAILRAGGPDDYVEVRADAFFRMSRPK